MSIITEALRKAQDHRNIVTEKKERKDSALPAPETNYIPREKIGDEGKNSKKVRPVLLLGFLFFLIAVFSLGIIFMFFSNDIPGRLDHTSERISVPAKDNKGIAEVSTPKEKMKIESFPVEKEEEQLIRALPVLSGIMFYSEDPKAIMDGTIVSAGSKVSGYNVIQIFSDSVEISDGNKKYSIKLR